MNLNTWLIVTKSVAVPSSSKVIAFISPWILHLIINASLVRKCLRFLSNIANDSSSLIGFGGLLRIILGIEGYLLLKFYLFAEHAVYFWILYWYCDERLEFSWIVVVLPSLLALLPKCKGKTASRSSRIWIVEHMGPPSFLFISIWLFASAVKRLFLPQDYFPGIKHYTLLYPGNTQNKFSSLSSILLIVFC